MRSATSAPYSRDVPAPVARATGTPSRRIPGRWGLYIAAIWSALSLAVACLLATWVIVATVVGLLLAWAYSAPPFRLKRNGWWGTAACGFSCEGLAWVTGTADGDPFAAGDAGP